MSRSPFGAPLGVAIAATAFAAVLAAQAAPTRQDADAARKKLDGILAAADQPGVPASRAGKPPRRTTVTEPEVNAYLTFEAPAQLPDGIVDAWTTLLGAGRVSGRAVVDLDAVRRARASTSLFDPRAFLRGRLPVTATGTLRAVDGMGLFELESATVGSVPIPKRFLQEIVSYYTKTPDSPSGVNLDDAFALPAGIREIQILTGQAVIVQ